MVSSSGKKVGSGHESWHGTETGYANKRCRCSRCRAGHAAYMRDYRTRNAVQRDPRSGRRKT